MKLVTFADKLSGRPGALLGSGDVIDLRDSLADRLDGPLWTIADLLGRGAQAMAAASELVSTADADPTHAQQQGWIVEAAEVTLLGPTGHNPMLWTVGPLYPAHMREMGLNQTEAESMSIALRNANSIIGSGESIRLPSAAPDMVDWEGELALVIGKTAHGVSPDDALDHVAGYTIYNDVSAREHTPAYVDELNQPSGASARNATLNLLYKEFPTFSPLGPCITTADEIDAESLVLTTRVNGEVMQDFRPGDTTFSLAEAISFASSIFLLKPGDIISLGTSTGLGYAQQPPRYLRPGDEVAITVDGIGTLRNPVVAPG
ncbi:fumarylacetoacetate hydrolase family protein [Gordonia sp. PKS22-38]|uniref:Fumarylacetoacetate hydrolase family protein n=1 Tax=Gordonia prachuapensis TaxID=3115651 RepID=A0ABU7MV50_9ACTN|nr:fumarylacetoacetate hydrolase family protein [Gordonia sp. PKS22-38]